MKHFLLPNMPALRPPKTSVDTKMPFTALRNLARASVVWPLLAGLAWPAWTAEPVAPPGQAAPASAAVKKPLISGLPTKAMAEQVKEAVETSNTPQKRLTLVVNGKSITVAPGSPLPIAPSVLPAAKPKAVPIAAPPKLPKRSNITPVRSPPSTKAVSSAVEKHWTYDGETGPLAWGELKPEFKLCGSGQRQSPINIDEPNTLQGPAEPLQFKYQPSTGSVVHNGHTLQVDVVGDNELTVRDSTFKLVQFHFHTPSEMRINDRSAAMVAHLVHKNDKGELAVVAVMLDPGVANSVINTVWTYMPLDANDRVRLPAGAIDLSSLLPKDQRYYQFIGSLTTPPCTEGVLWLVLKQATPISPEQLKLFTQLFPHNARPVQALNGRPVRNAQ